MTPPPHPSPPLLDRPSDIKAFLRLDQRMRIIGHRGYAGEAPENTAVSFEAALAAGVDMIEFDIQLTRDGEVVVFHDTTLDRTSTGTGPLADHTLEELRELDAGSWFGPTFAGQKIPTLEEILTLARGRTLLNIEIKSEAVGEHPEGGIEEKTLALVQKFAMADQVIVSSFHPLALRHMQLLDPSLPIATLYDEGRQAGMTPTQILAESNARSFNLSQTQVTPAIVQEVHALGLPVAVYTVNEPAMIQLMAGMGVNAIFTDFPNRAIQV